MNTESLTKRLSEVTEAIGQYTAHLNMLLGRKEELTFQLEELKKVKLEDSEEITVAG